MLLYDNGCAIFGNDLDIDLLKPSLVSFWADLTGPMRGITLVALASVCFATMHAMIRHVSVDLHAFEITFFRNFLGLIVFLPSILIHGFAPLRTRAWPLLSLRAILNAAAMLAFFYALTVAPLAQVTALWFSAPIFAALLSMVFLGEAYHARRWAALAAGCVGTLLIVRPGFTALDLGTVLAFGSAVLFGCTMTVVRALGRTETSITITAYMNIMLAILTLGPAISVWAWPEAGLWPWLIAIGAAGTCAQIAMAQALRETETSVIVPFSFLQLLWAAAYGYLFFAEVPGMFIWLGAAVIAGANSYMAYRENKLGIADRAKESVGSG